MLYIHYIATKVFIVDLTSLKVIVAMTVSIGNPEKRRPRMIKSESVKELATALSQPFTDADLEWRIQQHFSFKNPDGTSRLSAIVVPYVTARAVMNRLDDVLGIDGWFDQYNMLSYTDNKDKPDYAFQCTLSVRFGDNWLSKQDVAPFTNIEDVKGGCSDALKRTAVKFGIGRHLYELNEQWVDLETKNPKDDTYTYSKLKDGTQVWFRNPTVEGGKVVKKKVTQKQEETVQPMTDYPKPKKDIPPNFDKQKYIAQFEDRYETLDKMGVDHVKLMIWVQSIFGSKMETFDEIFFEGKSETNFMSLIAGMDRKIKDMEANNG
jgi:hypothetical protein